MNLATTSSSSSDVFLPETQRNLAENTTPAPVVMRDAALRARVLGLMESGVSWNRIAVEAKVSSLLLKLWQEEGSAPGVAEALSLWLSEIDAEISALSGGFVDTPTSRRIVMSFEQARQPKDDNGQRGIALIYGAAGIGKTETAIYYASKENHEQYYGKWPVVYMRVIGSQTFGGLLLSIVETAEGCEVWKGSKAINMVLERIPQGGLLIFDEAQLLTKRRMDELRIFPDQYGIAIAFMGNMAGYRSLEAAKLAQISSRVGGSRVIVDMPVEGDVDALLDAWEIRGRAVRKLAVMIGLQDGGLRYLADAVRTAKTYSKASGKPVDERMFKAAAMMSGAWGAQQ